MKRIGRSLAALAAFLLLALGSPGIRASSILPLDIDQIVTGAAHVAHVRCVGNEVQADPIAGAVTVTTFEVLERVKGNADRSFVMRQAGGELNGMKIDYHVPKFTAGDEYV